MQSANSALLVTAQDVLDDDARALGSARFLIQAPQSKRQPRLVQGPQFRVLENRDFSIVVSHAVEPVSVFKHWPPMNDGEHRVVGEGPMFLACHDVVCRGGDHPGD